MLKPYVERRNNLVKEPANVNVLVSETRTFSNNSRSSHFSPTDTTKLKNFSVVLIWLYTKVTELKLIG